MTNHTDQDLREWIRDWQADTAGSRPAPPAEEIRLHVRERERMLWLWVAVEVVIGLVAMAFLLHRALTHPDPVEKLAMGLLTLAVVAVMWFEGWNWRGTLSTSAQSTSTFLAIALNRSRRLERSLRAGWALLAAEVLIFTPWIWYNLRGDVGPSGFERSLFAWGLLASMGSAGALALLLLQRWAGRDAANLEGLRRELIGNEEETQP